VKKWSLFILPLFMIILSGCDPEISQISVNLGQEFSISPGHSIIVNGEDFKMKFADVIGDSRCPSGVTCIWAGQVSCILEITQNKQTTQTVITASGATDYITTEYQSYSFKFQVDPYPQYGKTINKGDYRLIMTITRDK